MYKRYKAIDNPLGFVIRATKPQRFANVTHYDDFTEDQKTNLQKIKAVIVSRLGECNIGVYGSQVRGNYDQTSDYDVRVYKDVSPADSKYLKGFDYGVKVDMFFSSQYVNSDLNILIK